MGSTFVTRREARKANKLLGTGLPINKFYIQFVPGTVSHVITNPESLGYSSQRDINAISAKPHITDDNKSSGSSFKKYYPLFRGMIDVPVKGEQVLLCTFGGINYYMGPVNTTNLPNWNIDHLYDGGIEVGNNSSGNRGISDPGRNFPKTEQKRLNKLINTELDFPINQEIEGTTVADIHGDIVIEGRHGNSIRMGSRYKSPYMILSNSRGENNTIESNHDGSIIAFLNRGSIHQNFKFDYQLEDEGSSNERLVEKPFILGSDSIESPKRFLGGEIYNYDYNKNQILFNSNRLTFNSKIDDITISSFNNLNLGSGNNFSLVTNGYTILESSNIFIGRQAKEKFDEANEDSPAEPLVLGKQLNLILSDLIDILKEFRVSNVFGGHSGIPTNPIYSRLDNLKNKLDAEVLLSDYHYIEDNGKKPEDTE